MVERLELTNDNIKEAEAPQLKLLLDVLRKKRKIVVIAGAGISVEAGIPDFRSSAGAINFHTSVYNNEQSASSFTNKIRELSKVTQNAKPTEFHHLLATLAQEDRLLRLYSQNFDGLDTSLPPLSTEVPLPEHDFPKTIQLHGSLEYMTCTNCDAILKFNGERLQSDCPQCVEVNERRGNKRQRTVGSLRPRILLDDDLLNRDETAIVLCMNHDVEHSDAVIVVGTRLKFKDVRNFARNMCNAVRSRENGLSIWINTKAEPTGKDLANWDLIVRGSCEKVAHMANLPKWTEVQVHSKDARVKKKERRRKRKFSPEKHVVKRKIARPL